MLDFIREFPTIIWKHITLTIVYLMMSFPFAHAQTRYTLIGSARSNSSLDCFTLTQLGNGQTGAVWFNQRLRLTESFELTFTINLGNNPAGADGLVLVFQTQGNQVLGGQAGGIGYKNIRPSLGVEFDTNQNLEAGDPFEDHIALVHNGISDHRLNKEFAQPIPILIPRTTAKDGLDHYVKVNWNATTHILLVEVDCIPRISQTIDLVNTIFSGTSEVIWGFTSATGARGNVHMVCISPKESLPDTIQACRNERIILTAPLSSNGDYQWTPSAGLDNPRSRAPHLLVSKSQLYTVQYVDHCAQPKFDSVFVNAKGVNFSIGNDRQICENDSITLTPTIDPNSTPITYRWSTGQITPQINPTKSGQYSLTITADGCHVSDSVKITFNPLPKLGLSTDTIYDCPSDQPILLDPQATGASLQYSWEPGASKEATLITATPGTYIVRVSTDIGCLVVQKFIIRDNCPSQQVFIPDAFTPNGDGINDLLKWRGEGNLDAQMKVFNRWGEMIFVSTPSFPYWDGTYHNKPCPPDTYTWLLEGWSQLAVKSRVFIMKGKVMLLKYSQ